MSDTVSVSNGEWREYKIGEISEVIGGGTPKTSVSEYWNGEIAWLTPKDLTGYSKIYISNGERSITKKGLQKSSAKLMPKGTVLLSSRAPIGYIAISNNKISTNQGFKSLIVNNELAFNIFIYYWLKNRVVGTPVTRRPPHRPYPDFQIIPIWPLKQEE